MTVFLLLIACASPEQQAGDLAVSFQQNVFNLEQSYPLACAEDKAAQTLAEAQAQQVVAEALLGESFTVLKEKADKVTYTVGNVTLGEDSQTTEVGLVGHLKAWSPSCVV